jgi:hypothetical protein
MNVGNASRGIHKGITAQSLLSRACNVGDKPGPGDLYVLTRGMMVSLPVPSSVASSLKVAAGAPLPFVPFACVGECDFLPPPFFLCAMLMGRLQPQSGLPLCL